MKDENKTVEPATITAAMAQKAIEDDRKRRVEDAKRLIDDVCQAHRVRLSAITVVQDNQVSSQVLIVAVE